MASSSNILVIEDSKPLRKSIVEGLKIGGFEVIEAASAEEGIKLSTHNKPSMVLSDLRLPKDDGIQFLEKFKTIHQDIPVVIMTAFGNIELAVKAMQSGATDFVNKPFDIECLHQLAHKYAVKPLDTENCYDCGNYRLLTKSPKFQKILAHAKRVAPLDTSVLILGESGTGKELLARYIHNLSARKDKQFVAVNCASMPGELLESEFFGFEAGAFTGANTSKAGLFEEACGGSIFLDEIGNMPYSLQMKLLRTLQESEIRRIGSTKTTQIDTRVISATHCDLEDEIEKKHFREDLFYRLGVISLEIPTLRDRPEDLPILLNYFIAKFAKQFKKPIPNLPPATLKFLTKYNWPGNVRELQNAVERAMIFVDKELTIEHFGINESSMIELSEQSLAELVSSCTKSVETTAIVNALNTTKGNKSKAAKILGVSYKTLLNKIKDYQIQ